jgi:hypothetical protein
VSYKNTVLLWTVKFECTNVLFLLRETKNCNISKLSKVLVLFYFERLQAGTPQV